MNTLKIVLKTLCATFAVLGALAAIGKVESQRKELEYKLTNCLRKNRVLYRSYNHALSHLTREERNHVLEDAKEDYTFETLIKDLKK